MRRGLDVHIVPRFELRERRLDAVMVVISDRCTLPARQNLVLHQGWSAGQWHQWDKRRWNHLPGSPSHRALCRAEGMSLRWRVTVIQQSKLETNRICRFLQQGLGNFNSWLCFAVALGPIGGRRLVLNCQSRAEGRKFGTDELWAIVGEEGLGNPMPCELNGRDGYDCSC